MRQAEFLRNVPVLSDLPDDLLEQIASEAGEVEVGAGEWLLREGDDAESLFLIRSGRMEVVIEGPPETVIRVLRRGQVLGELALLAGGKRSASVRAQRDSHLLEVSRSQFEALIGKEPGFALGLVRAMGAQLAASRAPAESEPLPATIAIVGIDGAANAGRAAELLAAGLRAAGGLAELRQESLGDGADMAEVLDRAQVAESRVLLITSAHEPGDAWTDFCLREADVIIALTSGWPSRSWMAHPEQLHGAELIVTGASEVEPGLVDALRPREVHAVQGDGALESAIASIARRLTGRSVGVVLSGGGARAFAHLGVVEELGAAGIEVDRIAGVSLGSAVGAGLAMGYSTQELAERFDRSFNGSNPSGDYTLPLFSLVRGRRTRALLEEHFGGWNIEALPKRYFCVSCDLIGREAVVHRTGPLVDAVHASLSIPGVFPPRPTSDGRLLVDGGVLDNLPVGQMASSGEGPVIAVDVTGRMGGFQKPPRPGIAKITTPLRRFLTGGEDELPRLSETIVRTVTVGSVDTAAESSRHADLVVEPQVDTIGLLDWSKIDVVREAGRVAAREALEGSEAWRSW